MIAGTHTEILPDTMRYKLCALFESRHALFLVNMPVLATAIWGLSLPDTNGPNGDVRYVLDENVSECLHFAHVIMGCDTILRLVGIGNSIGLTLLKKNDIAYQQAVVLHNPNSTPVEMVTTGEKTSLSIQGHINRYSRFAAILKISAKGSHLQSFGSLKGTISQLPCLP